MVYRTLSAVAPWLIGAALAAPVAGVRAAHAGEPAVAEAVVSEAAVDRDAIEAYQLQRRRMAWSLGGWAAANAVVGGVGWAAADAPEWQAFHATNLLWATVNVPFALMMRPGAAPEDEVALLRARESQRLVLWVNAGLDVAYIATGLCVHEVGRSRDGRLSGVGSAFVVQGAWLLAFDIVGAVRAGSAAGELWDGLRIAPTANGVAASLVW